jgi:AbrB family transcriptional regulator, stage V sporulation protein T
MTYHAKLIKGGKVVIPADLRRELGFEDGDKLVFERDGNGLVLKSFKQVMKEVQASVRAAVGPYEGSIVDEFLAEKYAETAAEDARDAMRF